MVTLTKTRIEALSDGVIAIAMTLLVLELKVPHDSSPSALLDLWPTFASYALSYLFVGIVWVNHHHLLRYAERADAPVIWSNLAFLFFVSLIPFFTGYVAETRMDPFPTALYAAIFLAITLAFMIFQRSITKQVVDIADARAMCEAGGRRNWIAAAIYALAIPAAYIHPAISLGLILIVGGLYFVPSAIGAATRPRHS